jgi:orotate phosphoribosyltransferase
MQVHVGDPADVAAMLATPGVVQAGHFRLLSGLHTDRFVAFSHVVSHPGALDMITDWISPAAAAWSPTGVLAPSTAGVGLAATLARRLSLPLHLADLDTRGRPNDVVGQSLPAGARVLLVNDVVTTGAGFRRLAQVAGAAGALIGGAAWFTSRGASDIGALIGAPTIHVIDLDLPVWSAQTCQPCTDGIAAVDAVDLN